MYKIYTNILCRPLRGIPKVWIMGIKLTSVLIFAAVMQVSAALFAQKITYVQKNVSLKQFFTEIRKQTGYDIIWTMGALKSNTAIDANFQAVPLEDVLKQTLKSLPLTYTIMEKTIVIHEKTPMTIRASINTHSSIADSVNYKGIVYDDKGKPLPGATVRVKNSRKAFVTTDMGSFTIYGPAKGILVISYLGYVTKEIDVIASDADRILKINLTSFATGLGEVSIVSTGYQDLPKERATGSFELISKEQLQHSTDPNLLKRLEGITTSIDFRNDLISTNSSRGTAPSLLSKLTIRGKNTLNITTADIIDPVREGRLSSSVSGRPLVVIDGIASPYSIDQVNPNDVESVTILKDAASASIWGSRAANGVIVIKTKKGSYENPVQVSFNSNVTVTEKMDLFYKKYMSTSDYVDAQMFLYNKQYDPNDPNAYIGDPILIASQIAISPVADIINRQKRGLLSTTEAKVQLDALRGNDIRHDQSQHLLRDAINQSYSLSLSGGSQKTAWRLSGGYDKTRNNTVNSNSNRVVVNYGISLKPLKNLELKADLNYNQNNTDDLSAYDRLQFFGEINAPYYIYTRLTDNQGNPAVVTRNYTPQFLNLLANTYGNKILDYQYKPLDDINAGYYKTKVQNANLRLEGTYTISPSLSANITFNENVSYNEGADLKRENSWYMRDLINRFTNPTTFARSLPLGAQYIASISKSDNQTLRGLLNFNKTWNKKHNLTAIAGTDISNNYYRERINSYFGYDENTLTSSFALDFKNFQRLLFADSYTGSGVAPLPLGGISNLITRVRTISYFSNAAYTFDQRYILSSSIRRDFSSLYGIGGNKGGTPFYSVGGSWVINNEKFYNLNWLPYLKLRTTFGYNGNVNPSTAAVPLLTFVPAERVFGGNRLEFYNTLNPTNSRLRPEKTEILNFGLDFGFKNNRLSGSIEYYIKNTKDLITTNAIDPSTGFNNLLTNAGNLRGKGIDLMINSLNLQTGLFRWNSNFLFSYNRVKVLDVYSPIVPTAGELASNALTVPPKGHDLSGIFAYRWAGLDPATGDPRGYVNDIIQSISNDQQGADIYGNITSAPTSTLRYFGPATPMYFGSLRNTFSYGNFSISANFQYKFNYWFRRRTSDMVFYYLLADPANRLQGVEYANRWQKPGDEKFTNVPSFTYPVLSPNRDLFYTNSEINVLKGDHIRLQEINLSYAFKKNNWFIKTPRVYANISNLGIIWRANKLGLDPDTYDYPVGKTYSIGLSANF